MHDHDHLSGDSPKEALALVAVGWRGGRPVVGDDDDYEDNYCDDDDYDDGNYFFDDGV